MKSGNTGTSTSEAEVTNVSQHGLWLLVKEKEYFLAYEQYPWFKAATIDQLFELQFLHAHHLHWPELDIDIHLDSLNNPEGHPLTYN